MTARTAEGMVHIHGFDSSQQGERGRIDHLERRQFCRPQIDSTQPYSQMGNEALVEGIHEIRIVDLVSISS